jgi:hypothetical protein
MLITLALHDQPSEPSLDPPEESSELPGDVSLTAM